MRRWMMTAGLVFAVCIGPGSRAQDARPATVLEPTVMTESFGGDSLGQWASYPPAQDVGYEPSLTPTVQFDAPGGRALMRVVKPVVPGPLSLGFIKEVGLVMSQGAELAFAYRLEPRALAGAFEVARPLECGEQRRRLDNGAQRNRELIERLEVLAERDRLTGLPNMRAFEEAVDRLFREQRPFGLLLGDMDGLREANEELGHGGGDVVLVRLAETLGKLLGPEERLARVGGDEFAILTTTRSKDMAADRANQLESFLADEGLRVTFGWAAFPGEGTNALGLLRVADERLYARKLVRGRRNGEPQAPKLGLTA